MFELVEDPGTQLERNWELPQRPSLVDSRTPWPHLPPAIAQSQEPLAAQHFGPQQALVKIREPQQERQWTLPRGADVRFCQLAPATGTQRAALQPRLARQRPRLFAVNAAAEAGPAWELLFSRECRIDRPMRAGVQFLVGNSESSLLARPGPLDADRDWDATCGKASFAAVLEIPKASEAAGASQRKALCRSEENTLWRRANRSPNENPSFCTLPEVQRWQTAPQKIFAHSLLLRFARVRLLHWAAKSRPVASFPCVPSARSDRSSSTSLRASRLREFVREQR